MCIRDSLGTAITPGTLVLTDACHNPETIISFFDQFYSEEGGIEAIMGIEGKTWQKTDDDKWEWILGNGYGDDVGTVRSSSTIQGAANPVSYTHLDVYKRQKYLFFHVDIIPYVLL